MLRGNSVSTGFLFVRTFSPPFVDLILEWVAGPRVDGVINRNQSNKKKKKWRKLKSSKLGCWESSLDSPSPATPYPQP